MIVTVEASFSGGKGSLLVEFLDFGVESIESQAQGPRELISLGQQGVSLRSQDAEVQLAVEECDFEPIGRGRVAMGRGNAMGQPFEAQPSQVIGHLSC